MYGVLGPLVTLLPLVLVFAESLYFGALLTVVTFLALFFSVAYGAYGCVGAALLFAFGIAFCELQTLSLWSLWSALTSGAIVTCFGFSELMSGQREPSVLPPLESVDHRSVTMQKLLQITRQQLKTSNADSERYKNQAKSLASRVKVCEGLFDEQNGQIMHLMKEMRAFEDAKAKLSQLGLGEEGLLKKAAAFDQLKEQFQEKREHLNYVRTECEKATLNSEALEREIEESASENLVDKLQKQLLTALARLENSRQEQKQLMEIISFWSKA